MTYAKFLPQKTKYYEWTILDYGHIVKGSMAYLNCQCSCGTIRLVRQYCLENGKTKSCGCRTREINKKLNTKHGLYYNKLYNTWTGMMDRCYNKESKAYKNYGARGIDVCERWHDIHNFVKDNELLYQENLSIDRIDNNSGYSPDNCRWATQHEQSMNRRNSIYLTFQGTTKPMIEWAEEIGIKYRCLYLRKRRGWSDEQIITTPIIYGRNQHNSPLNNITYASWR